MRAIVDTLGITPLLVIADMGSHPRMGTSPIMVRTVDHVTVSTMWLTTLVAVAIMASRRSMTASQPLVRTDHSTPRTALPIMAALQPTVVRVVQSPSSVAQISFARTGMAMLRRTAR